ncbi:hypothetical protein ABZ468_08935 [Streptomyces sp. NPDC005708]|uniref:hypothetical protein n=1 Tax=Streptomyces sp. NPDC005708 TaxID=3154564 RepID=UPI0033ED9C1C
MEQRIGSSSQPLDGAGMDPAFIPGLISPVSGEPGDAKPEDPESGVVTQETASDGAVSDAPAAEENPAGEKEPVGEPEEESPTESEPERPVFEASDRRARIVADHSGVQLRLDDQECEFRWDEIGAVETETSRFGKRFTVTVHTPERRWYPIEIEADSRSRFQEWEARLDEVLDTYFEDGEDKAAVLEKAED